MVKIGYLGPGEGTFGFAAAKKFYDQNQSLPHFEEVQLIPFINHAAITLAVGTMQVDFGVVAVENSIDGIISQTVRSVEEATSQFGVSIFSEILMPIRIFPFRKNGFTKDTTIRRLVSHASPLQQAARYVSRMQEDGIEVEQVESTDAAARLALEDESICAIGSDILCDLYDLEKISTGSIEDQSCNQTRFWVISKSYNPQNENRSKTAFLCFLDKMTPGGLAETFKSFAEADPPITVAIAYPIPLPNRNWEYAFLLEVYGHVSDDNMISAWQRLRWSGFYLAPPICLGSYPVG